MRILHLTVAAVFDDETSATLTWDILERELDRLEYATLADERVRLDTLIKTLRALNKQIGRHATNPAKSDVKKHSKARECNFRPNLGGTTKHAKTGGVGVENTGVYIGSGAKGSGWLRAKKPHKGDPPCNHFIPSGSWFWSHPVTADICCVACAPEGAK